MKAFTFPIRIRTWYYLTFTKKESLALPSDVRDYLVRKAIRNIKGLKSLSPEKQDEYVKMEMRFLVEAVGLSPETLNELAIDVMNRLKYATDGKCSRCQKPILKSKSVESGSGFLCVECASKTTVKG
jgi:hypothetical protein